jgi:hypothetical protein
MGTRHDERVKCISAALSFPFSLFPFPFTSYRSPSTIQLAHRYGANIPERVRILLRAD